MQTTPPDGQDQERTLYVFPSQTRITTALERTPGRQVVTGDERVYQLVRYGSVGQRVVLAELSLLDLIGLGLVCAAESRANPIVR